MPVTEAGRKTVPLSHWNTMPLDLRSIAIMAICFLTGVVIVGLAWFVRGRPQPGQSAAAVWERDAGRIAATVSDYFKRSGVSVVVGCVSLRGDGRFTVYIESEPMKRFRLSHLIELTLMEHVAATCKLEIEKIFWRFVVNEMSITHVQTESALVSQAYVTENLTGQNKDVHTRHAPAISAATQDSIEGSDHYKHLPQVEVTELSWEKYQEVSTSEAEKRSP